MSWLNKLNNLGNMPEADKDQKKWIVEYRLNGVEKREYVTADSKYDAKESILNKEPGSINIKVYPNK